jgi:hypothetical protein
LQIFSTLPVNGLDALFCRDDIQLFAAGYPFRALFQAADDTHLEGALGTDYQVCTAPDDDTTLVRDIHDHLNEMIMKPLFAERLTSEQ